MVGIGWTASTVSGPIRCLLLTKSMSYIYVYLLYNLDVWFYNSKSIAKKDEKVLSTGIFLLIDTGNLLKQESSSFISVWEGLASKLYMGWISWSRERGDVMFPCFAHALLLGKKNLELIHLCLCNLDTGHVYLCIAHTQRL